MLEYHSRVLGAVVALSLILGLVLLSSCKTPSRRSMVSNSKDIVKCIINKKTLIVSRNIKALKVVTRCIEITKGVREIAKQVGDHKLKDTLTNMYELTEKVVEERLDLLIPSNARKTIRQSAQDAAEEVVAKGDCKVITLSVCANKKKSFDLVEKAATTSDLENIFFGIGVYYKSTKKHASIIVDKSVAKFSIRYIIEDDQGKDK